MKGVIYLMGTKDILGTRMKEFYENVPKTKLMRRCPVMVRLRWKSISYFHKRF